MPSKDSHIKPPWHKSSGSDGQNHQTEPDRQDGSLHKSFLTPQGDHTTCNVFHMVSLRVPWRMSFGHSQPMKAFFLIGSVPS